MHDHCTRRRFSYFNRFAPYTTAGCAGDIINLSVLTATKARMFHHNVFCVNFALRVEHKKFRRSDRALAFVSQKFRQSRRGMVNTDKILFSSHRIWSPCTIWLLSRTLCRGGSQNISAGAHPLGQGACLTPRSTLLPALKCYHEE